MRVRPLIAVLPMLAATWAAADTPSIPDEEIIVLRVDGQEAGAPLLVRRDAGGVLLGRTEDFQALRLRPPQEATVIIDGVAYFRVGATIGADVRFDAATQSADVTLPANAFLPSVAALERATLHPATVSPGAFLNYNLSTQQVAGVDESGALLELGAFGRHGVLTNSMVAQHAPERSGATRLDTPFTYDMP